MRHLWATPILYAMGFLPKIKREYTVPNDHYSYMLVANHYSMMDIMLMLYCRKNPFVFVGKKELSKLPLFGYFYKRVAIMVDRKSPQSRREVYTQAMERIGEGLSICIFPEGGVPDDESIVLDSFKDGAFRIAIECQIPIVPMVSMIPKAISFPLLLWQYGRDEGRCITSCLYTWQNSSRQRYPT